MIGETISHYKITEKLGGGGMGIVYKAQDLKLKRTVALKFLPPDLTRDEEAKERFIHEAQAASALDHPNICSVHEVAETGDGQTFIVMGYYEGQTLKRMIESGPLDIPKSVEIARQVAEGLARAHEAGIVHRDIKPANIMVTNRGEVKIVDFGLAKLSGRTLLTKSGTTLGTAAYMSPEQARGEQVDHRSDIWSLGVVLYEMLTGKRPFESEYEQALVYSILSEDPKPIRDFRSEVPEAMEKICRRAMAKGAKDRYQTVDELINDLESYRSGKDLSRETRKVRGTKRRFVYTGLVVGVLALALVGILTFTGKGEVFDHIAVLPFQVTSTDSTHEALGFGMAEEVIARLVGISTLNVPAIKSTMKYKGSTASYAEIARELGAKALVDGSVQKMNNRIHVIVKLIDPSTGRQLWSEPYDDSAENILDLQSRIAQAVVRAVRVKVSEEEQDHLARPQKKVDPRAYELYVNARDMGRSPTNPSRAHFDSIITTLQRAIDIEPDNASYHAELAFVYSQLVGYSNVKNSDVSEKMKVAAETALKLDPDLAQSQWASGVVAYSQLRFGAALSHTARALELAPGNPDIYLIRGYVLMAVGRIDEALAMFRHSYEVDPVAGRIMGYSVGMCYLFMRRYDDAITSLKQWLPQYPRSNMGHTFLAYAYSMKGMHKEALAHNDSAVHWGKYNRPLILYRAGQHELASKAFKETLPFQNDYNKATWFGFLGQKDSAFSWLERFSQSPSGEILFIRHDPWLDNLRDDPRFKEILRNMNLLD